VGEQSVFIERDDGEYEEVFISELTYVAVDRDGAGRAFSENRFHGRISDYEIDKIKASKSEIIHCTDYRATDWLKEP
jgi:hypothetical protein